MAWEMADLAILFLAEALLPCTYSLWHHQLCFHGHILEIFFSHNTPLWTLPFEHFNLPPQVLYNLELFERYCECTHRKQKICMEFCFHFGSKKEKHKGSQLMPGKLYLCALERVVQDVIILTFSATETGQLKITSPRCLLCPMPS